MTFDFMILLYFKLYISLLFSISSQFVFVKTEWTNYKDVIGFVKDEPRIFERIEIPHNMLTTSWGIAFRAHNGNLA